MGIFGQLGETWRTSMGFNRFVFLVFGTVIGIVLSQIGLAFAR